MFGDNIMVSSFLLNRGVQENLDSYSLLVQATGEIRKAENQPVVECEAVKGKILNTRRKADILLPCLQIDSLYPHSSPLRVHNHPQVHLLH